LLGDRAASASSRSTSARDTGVATRPHQLGVGVQRHDEVELAVRVLVVLPAIWLHERGAVRGDIDKHTIATMCFGSYFAAFYRGESTKEIPAAVVAVLWPAIASKTSTTKRRTTDTAKRAR